MSRMRQSNLNGTIFIVGKHTTLHCEQCQEAGLTKYVLISCSKHTKSMEMVLRLQRLGLLEISVKSILGYGGSGLLK